MDKKETLYNLCKRAYEHNSAYKYLHEFLENSNAQDDALYDKFRKYVPITEKEDLIEWWTKALPRNHSYHICFSWQSRWSFFRNLLFGKIIFQQSTGGTSWKSTIIYQDLRQSFQMLKSFIHSFNQLWYRFWDRFLVFYPRDAYFTNQYEKYGFLTRMIGFKMMGFEEVTLEQVKTLIHTLNRYRPKLLVIFPFVLYKVSKVIKDYNLKLEYIPPMIDISWEALLETTFRYIKEAFHGSKIEGTYGAVEFGEIAHQSWENLYSYCIFDDYAYVEQSDDWYLIVTNLRHTFHPIIRYKMTDFGEVRGNIISPLVGRDVQVFDKFGKRFTVLDVNNLIEKDELLSIHLHNIKVDVSNELVDVKFCWTEEFSTKIWSLLRDFFSSLFKQRLLIEFVNDIEHNYLKKYKTIENANQWKEPVWWALTQ